MCKIDGMVKIDDMVTLHLKCLVDVVIAQFLLDPKIIINKHALTL